MTSKKPHILYVDDEEFNLTSFKATFRPFYTVHTAVSASDGTAILNQHPIELIITDQRMPGVTGVEFLEHVRAVHPKPIRMVLTGFADIEAIIDSINKGGVYRYITKPWEEDDLKMVIDGAIETYRLRGENSRLLEHLARYNDELERTVAERTAELKYKSDELEVINRSVIEQNKHITKLSHENVYLLMLAGQDLQHPTKDILRTAEHGIERGSKLSADDAVAHLSTIKNAATRIHGVLENLLLLNAIENSGVKVYPTNVDPGMIAQTVVLTHSAHAKSKNIAIHTERKGDFAMAHTDPTGLQMILEHLVSNAVKFSRHDGQVTVVVEPLNGGVTFSVRDTGPGFTDEDRSTLFTKFATHSAKPSGGELTTGLGLSIVKSYVNALSGSIALESTSAAGSTFTITLPSLHR